MKEKQAISVLSALSHEMRLRIVRHLVAAGDAGAAAGAIGVAIKAAPSKVTFHISALERAGIVRSEKVSRSIVYRVEFKRLGQLLRYLMHDCCGNNEVVVKCCEIDCDQC